MDSILNNKNIMKLVSIFLAVLSLFFVAKFFTVVKDYQYIGNQYPPQNVISVSGTADVYAVPDIAEITFDVSEKAKTTPEAQKLVTDKMNAILASLKKSGIADKDVKTVGYNIYPEYEYQTLNVICPQGSYCPPNPGKQVLTGYRVTHSIDLKVRKTDQAGQILSDLGTLNVTNLSGINFTIDDQQKVQDDARAKAITDAKDKADVLARALGVRLVRIVSFNESGNYPIYYAKAMMADGRGGVAESVPAPQVPSGENKVTSNVTITYEIR